MNLARAIFSIFALAAFTPASSASPVDQVNGHLAAQLQLRLTHTLFEGTLAAYFDETGQTFNPTLIAERAYLQTFLTEWSTRIDSGKYHSTLEIFGELTRGSSYLAVNSSLWRGITQVRRPPGVRGLGESGYREQFLDQVLQSEARFLDIDQRLQQILYFTSLYLVTSGGDPVLARAIAEPFVDAEAPVVREAAANVLANIPFERKASYAVLAFDLLGLTRGTFGMRGLSKLFGIGRMSERAFAGAGQLGRSLYQTSARLANPFARRMTVRRWSFLAASSAHAGAGMLFWPTTGAAAKANQSPVSYRSSILQLGSLWDNLNDTYPLTFSLADFSDFTPSYRLDTKDAMIARVRARLNGVGSVDFGREFILAEKLRGIDGRAANDLMATEFVSHRYEVLRAKVAALFGSDPITDEKYESFRSLVIEDLLYAYKRDYPSVTTTLMGWGGNCVAETLMMVALLEPYRNRLPGGRRLVVTRTSLHMEAGLYDGHELSLLIEGSRTTNINQTIYKPEYLLILLLRNYPGALPPIHVRDYIEYWPSGVGEISADADWRKNADKRPGVIDNYELGDLSPGSRVPDEDIPYDGQIGYSATHERHGGRWSDGMSHPNPHNKNKPRSSITIGLNLQLQPHAIADFKFDLDARTLTVYNAAVFAEFQQLRRQPKMDDEKLLRIIRIKQTEGLDRFANSGIVQKMYGTLLQDADPVVAYTRLLSLTPEDLAAHDRAVAEFNGIVRYFFEGVSATARPDLASIGPLNKSIILNDAQAVSIGASTLARYEALAKGEARLTASIARNPRAFLTVYDQATLKIRDYMLVRFFGTSFWKLQPDLATDGVSLRLAKANVRDFLGALDNVKVSFDRERFWLCDEGHVHVNLPVVPGWGLTEESNSTCGTATERTANPTAAKAGPTASTGKPQLELKVSTLIELTVGFGDGLQLWNADVVDAFLHGRYEQIGPDRATARILIKRLVLSDPTYAKDPRFAPLLTGV